MISPQGLHLIASFEGYVPIPYNDSAGNATVGYGHLIHPGPVTVADRAKYRGWDSARFLELLNDDALVATHTVTQAIAVSLGVEPQHAQARFDALVSLAFNIGSAAFARSQLVHAINAKPAPRDWHEIAPLWLEWDHAGGVVVPGLLNRRRAELAIFIPGAYPPH